MQMRELLSTMAQMTILMVIMLPILAAVVMILR
jgi:hypothetical protein